MPYTGWFSLGGTEIVNAARAKTYVQDGMPEVSWVHDCGGECACDNLPAFLGDIAYGNPLNDDAPWVDVDRPESFDFLGVYPVDITGLDDDPVTAESVEGMADGGWITAVRRSLRDVVFDVVLASRSEEADHYGMAWLKAALDGSCASGCVTQDQLCFLTACVDPAGFNGTERTTKHALTEWELFRSTWQQNLLVMNAQDSWARISLRGSCSDVVFDLRIKGDQGSRVLIQHDGVTEIFEMTGAEQVITVTSESGSVRLAVPDVAGMASWAETAEEGSEFASHFDTDPSDGSTSQSRWRQWTSIPLPIEIREVISTARFEVDPEACAATFYRFLRRVRRIDGPRTRRVDVTSDGGILRRVTFTIQAERPALYGLPTLAAEGSSSGVAPTAVPYRVVELSQNIPMCTTPAPTMVYDPLGGITLPPPIAIPQANELRDQVILDAALAVGSGAGTRPYALIIPAETIPEWLSVVPIVRLTADTSDVRFAQVRFFPMPFETTAAADIDPCSACGAFEISYIPAGATFVVDAADEQATIQRGESSSTAMHLLTDENGRGGPRWPELSCGVGYMAVIDSRGQRLSRIEIELAVKE